MGDIFVTVSSLGPTRFTTYVVRGPPVVLFLDAVRTLFRAYSW